MLALGPHPPQKASSPTPIFRKGGLAMAANEIYSWNPVHKNKGSSPAAPSTGGEPNVRFQSGLKQQVSVRLSELQQEEAGEKEPSQKVRTMLYGRAYNMYWSYRRLNWIASLSAEWATAPCITPWQDVET